MEKVLRVNWLFPWAKKRKEHMNIIRSVSVKNWCRKNSRTRPSDLGMPFDEVKYATEYFVLKLLSINTFSFQAILQKKIPIKNFQRRIFSDLDYCLTFL
jgi:hypothetical protein